VKRVLTCAVALWCACAAFGAGPKAATRRGRRNFEATAYSRKGHTESGAKARRGVVAADPRVLPKGSIVEVKGAGRYSGRYKVADTGATVKGHKLDIYVPNPKNAKQFGRKKVQVKVVKRGEEPDE
jgi:3D (Asp-Asp-Asp) domain-containing protein